MELFGADTGWVHIFRAMIDSGDCAELGPHAMVVYLVIKSHVNLKTGHAFPGIATIAKAGGMSEKQVKRSLAKLTTKGYLLKDREGRRNTYRLLERFPVEDGPENQVATLTADYIPIQMRGIQNRIQEMLRNGEIARGQTLHVSLNVQVVANTVQVNGGDGVMIIGGTTPT